MAEWNVSDHRAVRVALWVLPALGVAGCLLALLLAPGVRLSVLLPLWLAPLLLGLLGAAACAAALRLRVRERHLLREQAAQLQLQAEQARRRLLRRLDHELKNPLTVLQTVVDAGDEQPDENRQIIAGQVQRLSRLVGDLRGLAELEVTPLERIDVDLQALLREVLDDAADGPLGAEAQNRRISLHLPRAPWPLPLVRGDPDLLRLCLQNLVGNAIKYSAPGDSIEITAQELDGWAIIDIADTGRGVPRDEQQLVFWPVGPTPGRCRAPASGWRWRT